MGRCLVAAAGAVLLIQLLSVSSDAHAALVSSDPADGATLSGSPGVVVLRFSQDLDPSRTSVELRDPDGLVVAEGGEITSARELRLVIPALVDGIYEVRWTSFSAEDAELERGRFNFMVHNATESTSPSPVPASSVSVSTPMPATVPSPSQQTTPPASLAPVPTVAPVGPGASADGGTGGLVVAGSAMVIVISGIVLWAVRRRAR